MGGAGDRAWAGVEGLDLNWSPHPKAGVCGMTKFFAVIKTELGLGCAIYHDEPPIRAVRNQVYIRQLDPEEERLTLGQLFTLYKTARDIGALRPGYQPPPKAGSGPTTISLGERVVMPRDGLPDPPYDPHKPHERTPDATPTKRAHRRPTTHDQESRSNAGRPPSSGNAAKKGSSRSSAD